MEDIGTESSPLPVPVGRSAEEFAAEVNACFDRVGKQFDRVHDRIGTRFYWTIGLIVTLLGVQDGIMLALFKL